MLESIESVTHLAPGERPWLPWSQLTHMQYYEHTPIFIFESEYLWVSMCIFSDSPHESSCLFQVWRYEDLDLVAVGRRGVVSDWGMQPGQVAGDATTEEVAWMKEVKNEAIVRIVQRIVLWALKVLYSGKHTLILTIN